MSIKVEKVSSREVDIKVLNVLFHFFLNSSGEIKYTKTKDSQVHDPDACWVPNNLFKKAYCQAAPILKKNRNESRNEP